MDKNKIITAATKYVQKGQYDKAIAEYRRIVDHDPKDVRILLKIGELQQKKGENEPAANTLLDVAKAYAADGFFLKAVAVFKQVLKLSPDRVEVILRLAELYQQLGLLSDAMGQLQSASAHYERTGQAASSVEILRRMVELEPENVASRLRLAELLEKQGDQAGALQELRRTAERLRGGSRVEDFVRVGERIVQLAPKDTALGRELAQAHLARGDVRRALERLQVCFGEDPRHPETLDLLAKSFVALGQRPKAISVYKELARAWRERGDVASEQATWRRLLELAPDDADARQALGIGTQQQPQQAPAPAAPPRLEVSAVGGEFAVPETSWAGTRPRVAPPTFSPGPPPPPPRAVPQPEPSNRGPAPAPAPQELSWPPGKQAAVPAPTPTPAPSPIARLLTETDVFVKYGLIDKAREHLQKIFAADPECVAGHEKAVELLRDRDPAGHRASLVALARLCVKNGEVDRGRPHFEALRALQPNHPDVAALAPIYHSAAPVQEIDEGLILDEGAGDLPQDDEPLFLPLAEGEEAVVLDVAGEEPVELEALGEEPLPAFAAVEEDELLALAGDAVELSEEVVDEPLLYGVDGELEVAEDEIPEAPTSDTLQLLARDEESHGPADEQTVEVGFEATREVALDATRTVELPVEATREVALGSEATHTSELPLAALGAEATRTSELPIPGADLAATRTAELPADPFAPPDLLADTAELTADAPTAPGRNDATLEVDFDAITASRAPLDGPPAASRLPEPGLTPDFLQPAPQDPVNPWRVGDAELADVAGELEEAEFYLQQGLLDEAEELFRAVDRRVPGHPQAALRLGEIAARRSPDYRSAVGTVEDEFAAADELFDLGAALAEELEEEPAAAADAPFQYPADEVLEAFKKGVAQTVRPEDVETHYDLAIAYREMGLLADAISTFEQALSGCAGTARAVDCLTMIGLCHRALGAHDQALARFREGLEVPALAPEVEKALRFEIALSLESLGDLDEALAAFGEVARLDGAYRDVKAAIARLVAAGAVARPLGLARSGNG